MHWLLYTVLGVFLFSVSGFSGKTIFFVAVLAFIIVFSYEPLLLLSRQLYLQFFKSSYLAREQMFIDLEKDLTINIPYNLLVQRFLVTIARVFNSDQLILFIEHEKGYTIEGSAGFKHYLANRLSFLPNHPLVEVFQTENKPFLLNRAAIKEILDIISEEEAFPEGLYGIPLKSSRELLGGIILSNLPPEISRYWKIRDWAHQMEHFALILDNAHLYHSLEQEIQHKEILLSLNKKISTQIHLDDILETLIGELHRIIPYDAAGIFIRGSSSEKLRYLKVKGYDITKLNRVRLKAGHGIVNWCMSHGLPRIVPDTSAEPLYYVIRESVRSEICVPIRGSEGILGALNLESDQPNYYTNEDLDLLSSVADLASIAIQNARLMKEAIEKREVMNDIEIAAEIQRAIMPRSFPDFERFDLHAVFIPSRGISGDLYDFARFSSGEFGLTIGDVSGKGIPASLLMATIYAFYRNAIRSGKGLSEIFSGLNNDLYQATGSDRFSTLFYTQINPETLEIRYVNAGHNPPFILHADKNVTYLETGGPVLGVIPDATYQEGRLQLKTGDILFMYTDGVTEAFNDVGEEFGEKRLLQCIIELRDKSVRTISEGILEKVRQFSASEHFYDDLTMVILKVLPSENKDKSLDK